MIAWIPCQTIVATLLRLVLVRSRLIAILIVGNLLASMVCRVSQVLLPGYLTLVSLHHLLMSPLLCKLSLSLSLERLQICHLVVSWFAIGKGLQTGSSTRVGIVEVRDRVTMRIGRHFDSITGRGGCLHHFR